MKIWINGIIRDMTADEEAQFRKDRESQPAEPKTETIAEKLEAFDIIFGGGEA